MCTQMTKALLVRGHARAMQNVDRLFELFDEEEDDGKFSGFLVMPLSRLICHV